MLSFRAWFTTSASSTATWRLASLGNTRDFMEQSNGQQERYTGSPHCIRLAHDIWVHVWPYNMYSCGSVLLMTLKSKVRLFSLPSPIFQRYFTSLQPVTVEAVTIMSHVLICSTSRNSPAEANSPTHAVRHQYSTWGCKAKPVPKSQGLK